jgi:hypothetical protein
MSIGFRGWSKHFGHSPYENCSSPGSFGVEWQISSGGESPVN